MKTTHTTAKPCGNRVKGTVGGTTTAYIGSHFEWKTNTSDMIKYYYSGGTRVAMRVGSSTRYYLLSDHLGSTMLQEKPLAPLQSHAVIANSSGAFYSEKRYMPWGEERWASGTMPTTYMYTGQREQEELGLYFYNARWYDAALGRFLSADSIIPDPYNSQAFDRYTYVLNSPLNYVDPSGHGYCDNDNKYNAEGVSCDMTAQDILGTYYSVVFDDASEWGDENMLYVYIAVQTVGAAFVQQIFASIRGTLGEIFQDVYGLSSADTMLFEWDPKCSGCRPIPCQNANSWTGNCAPAFGVTNSKHHIEFASMSSISRLRRINNVIHELGHAFNVSIGKIPENAIGVVQDLLQRPAGFYGYPGAYTWVQSPEVSPSEIFADQFIGWVYGLWGSDSIGPIRAEFMNQMNGINGWVSWARRLP